MLELSYIEERNVRKLVEKHSKTIKEHKHMFADKANIPGVGVVPNPPNAGAGAGVDPKSPPVVGAISQNRKKVRIPKSRESTTNKTIVITIIPGAGAPNPPNAGAGAGVDPKIPPVVGAGAAPNVDVVIPKPPDCGLD